MVLNSKSYISVILGFFSALVYNLLLEPYGRVSRRAQELEKNGLETVKLFFPISQLKILKFNASILLR